MRGRIFLALLGLSGVVLGVLATVEERMLRRQWHDHTVKELEGAARAISLMLPPDGDPDALADHLGRVLQARVTLIGPDGRVRGDTDFSGPALESLGSREGRPEVQAARETGSGSARRLSESVGARMQYFAVAAPDGWVARVALSLAEIEAVVAEFRRGVLLAGAIAIIASFLLAGLLALGLSRPLRRAAEIARKMARGELHLRLPEGERGEVGDLYRALNRLAEDLERRLQELEQEKAESETLLREMGEGVLAVSPTGTVVRANAALARALGGSPRLEGKALSDLFRNPELVRFLQPRSVPDRGAEAEFKMDGRTWRVSARRLPAGGVVAVFADLTRLRRLEAVRSEFVANASHELKTPLTAVRGYAETLLDDRTSEDDRESFARRIVEHADRMTAIVEDLLTLARLESPGRLVRREPVALHPLVDEAWRHVSDRAEAAGIRFSAEVDPPGLEVEGDPEGVRQILENLLDNAIRHSGSQEVGVRAARLPARGVQLTVWDVGEGIPSVHLERIFERFYRVDPSRSRATGGTGLGLSIVKHWAEAMGGRAWAESTLGQGTKIHVTLAAPSRERVAPE